MLGADGKVAQLLGAGVDDLVGGFLAPGGAGNDVANTNGISRFSDPNFATTQQYEKRFLLGRMIVKRHRAYQVAQR